MYIFFFSCFIRNLVFSKTYWNIMHYLYDYIVQEKNQIGKFQNMLNNILF